MRRGGLRKHDLGRRSVHDCSACHFTLMFLPKDLANFPAGMPCQRCGATTKHLGDVLIVPWTDADPSRDTN